MEKKQNNQEVKKEEKKKLSKKSKIVIALITLIIIIGAIITATIGLNFDLRYRESKKIELYLEKDFNIADIKKITDEVMEGKEVIIQ